MDMSLLRNDTVDTLDLGNRRRLIDLAFARNRPDFERVALP